MRKKSISLLVSAAMVAAALSGCGSSNGTSSGAQPVSNETVQTQTAAGTEEASPEAATNTSGEITGELNLVHYLTETAKLQALDDMVAGFEAEYPGVKVNLESTSMDNYQDVIKLKISTGDAPDIIFGSCKVYSDLVQADCIENLAGQEFVDRIADGSLPNVVIDEGVYGVPLDQMANVVFYNKDYFEQYDIQVPKTYDEFIQACKTLEENGITPLAAGYQDTISLGANIYTLFYGAKYLECETYASELMSGASAHDYPSMHAALEQWREVMQYQNKDQKTIDTDRAEQLFANGETGMIIIGTWGLGAIMNYNPDGNYGGFMYPSENKKEDNAIPVATDDTWMVVKDSPNKAAALAFCEYMTRPDVNAAWCGTTSQLSALEGVTVDTLPVAAQDIAKEIEENKVSAWISVCTFSGLYDSTWYTVLQDYALTDNMTVEQFCDELDNEFAAADK